MITKQSASAEKRPIKKNQRNKKKQNVIKCVDLITKQSASVEKNLDKNQHDEIRM